MLELWDLDGYKIDSFTVLQEPQGKFFLFQRNSGQFWKEIYTTLLTAWPFLLQEAFLGLSTAEGSDCDVVLVVLFEIWVFFAIIGAFRSIWGRIQIRERIGNVRQALHGRHFVHM